MSRGFSILLVILTIVSGLIGGTISGRIFAPKVAIAEENARRRVLTVEELRIVDENGKLLMTLGSNDRLKGNSPVDSYGLAIYDNNGNITASMYANGVASYIDMCVGKVFIFDKETSNNSIKALGDHILHQKGSYVSIAPSFFQMVYKSCNFSVGGTTSDDIPQILMGLTDRYNDASAGGVFIDTGKGKNCVTLGGNNAVIEMNADKSGGRIGVYNKDEHGSVKGSVEMTVNEYGGRLDAYGKVDEKTRASMQIDEYGNGTIGLWDKNGYKLK